MKIAIIGFGHAGQIHLSAVRELPGIEAVAVCDPSPERRQAAAALGLRSHGTLHELLLCEDLDAVVISTPPQQHVAAALACLAQGIHVLCEKPLATASPEALAMFRAANHHTRLAVASKFRHVEALRRVRDLLVSGALGEPVGFHVSFRSKVDMSARWNSRLKQSGGGVIADNASHVFDIVAYLLGPLASVSAVALAALQPLEVEDSAALQIETSAGVVGSAELSWSLPPAGDAYVTLQASEATVVVGWKRSAIKRKGQAWESFGDPYDRTRAHRSMHLAFAQAAGSGHGLWITREECLQTVAAVEACYRSLRSGNNESLSATTTPLISSLYTEETTSAPT